MSRSSLAAAGMLSLALLAGPIATAGPAAASGFHLECVGTATSFICDLNANSPGSLSNERWTRNGVAYPVGDNRSSVKFLCSGSPTVAIGVYYTEDGVASSETTDYVCSGLT